MNALRLALGLFTVLPAGQSRADERQFQAAITLAPLVGALLGALAAGVRWTALTAGAPPLLAGLVTVAALALATRGLHLDGLADTVDGLGSYRSAERALEVMRDGTAGPFAVIALVLVLCAQAASIGSLGENRWGATILAVVTGRAAFTWCCRRGVPAARPDGMGALVAGSQPLAVPVLWLAVLLAGAVVVVPHRPWQGPAAVIAAAAVIALLCRHANRRLGGITGDVLGAACELATTVVLIGCALGR